MKERTCRSSYIHPEHDAASKGTEGGRINGAIDIATVWVGVNRQQERHKHRSKPTTLPWPRPPTPCNANQASAEVDSPALATESLCYELTVERLCAVEMCAV